MKNKIRKLEVNIVNNVVMPKPCKILDVVRETETEYTFKVETDIAPEHGQFIQLSIPKIGEAPISVSSYGEGWVEFTIRSVGKVTNKIFELKSGDTLFLRGAYGKGWPVDKFKNKNMVIIAGGTGVAPIRSMVNKFYDEEGYVKSVNIIIGFKNEKSVIFKKELDKWSKKFNTTYCLDKEEKEGFNKGFVTEYIKDIPFKSFGDNYETVIVGPPNMMKFAAKECMNNGVPQEKIWVSFERKMSCAVGKCGHCRIDETYVCLEGPVFNYVKAKDLID